MQELGEVSLQKRRQDESIEVSLPADLSRSLKEAGYTKARILLDEEGIHLIPFKAPLRPTIPLPEFAEIS